jgi:lysophospholipase L1-like esterase
MRKSALLAAVLAAALLHPSTAAHAADPISSPVTVTKPSTWVGTWSAAANGGTSATGYAGYTIRNLVHTSVGGDRVRVKVSNAFGTAPVLIAHTTVGLQKLPASAAIAAGTLRDVTFGGQQGVTIPAGAEVYSDPVKLPLADAADLFVTTFTPDPSGPVTYHAAGMSTSYYATDGTDHAADLGASGLPLTTGSWHYVTEVDVQPGESPGAVVTLGDSITDGINSTSGTNRRWPDLLATRLREQPGNRSRIGVLNAGISGNRVLLDGAGVRATARLDRDVLQRTGARTLIVLEGINDIQQTPHQLDPDKIIAGLKELTDRAHAAGLRVLGGTVTPFKGWYTYDASEEAAREGVNRWIRESGAFDAVVDFDAAIRDPADPQRMLPAYDSGDHLHPGDAGYQAMADAVDLRELGSPGAIQPAPRDPAGRSLSIATTPDHPVAIAGRATTVSFPTRVIVQGPGTVHGTLTTTLDGVSQNRPFAVRSENRMAQVDLAPDIVVPATASRGEHRISFTVRTVDGSVAGTAVTLTVDRVGCAQTDDACPVGLGYDHDSIATAAHPDDGNFDGLGWSYAAETLPATGPVVLSGTPFAFPTSTDGVANTLTASGQTLSLPNLHGSRLRILAASYGGAVNGTGTITYTDGSTAQVPLRFSDWASGPQAGEDVAVAAPYRLRAGVGRDGPPVDIYAQAITLDPARAVRSIELPDQPRLRLFAVTLQQAG